MALQPLNIYTMLVLLCMGNVAALSVLLLYTGASSKTRYYVAFMSGKFIQAFAWGLLSFRGVIPDLYSINFGNSLLYFGFALECLGLTSYRKRNIPAEAWFSVAAVLGTIIFVAPPLVPSVRVVVASAITLAMYLPLSVFLFTTPRATRLAKGLGAIDFLFSLSLVFRIHAAATSAGNYGLFTADLVQTVTFLPLFFILLSNGIAFLLLIKEQDDERLTESNDEFNTLYRLSPYSIILLEIESGRIMEANNAFERLSGFSRAETIGKTTEELHLWVDDADRIAISQLLQEMGSVREMEVAFHTKDGSIHRGLVSAEVVKLGGKPYALSSFHDISERKAMEESIKAHLTEQELLLKEVHHRIKNNLNTVIGLLSLQADAAENEGARETLEDAANRMQGMSLLYDKLYCAADHTSVSAGEFIHDLTEQLQSVFPRREFVEVELLVEDYILAPKLVSPLGLLINELFTNSMKYAFQGRSSGSIRIELTKSGSDLRLVYEDDGIGLREYGRNGGFGLQLIQSIAEQLKAEWTAPQAGSARYEFRFPGGAAA